MFKTILFTCVLLHTSYFLHPAFFLLVQLLLACSPAFLVYRDRGMGRVSLTGYYKGILKVRMDFSGHLTSVVSLIQYICTQKTVQNPSLHYHSFSNNVGGT